MKQRIFLFLAFFLISLFSKAAIPPQEVLDTRSIKPVAPVVKTIQVEDVALIIPTNLQPGTKDEETIMGHIMDHSVNSFVQGDYFRNTEFGKAASKVEDALKTEVTLGGGVTEEGEPALEHKLNFQFAAWEQRAFLTYRGLTNIHLAYTAASSNLDITMNQAMSASSTLVLSHHTREALSRINMIWAW